MSAPSVLSIFGVKPFRIGSNESFAREVSHQLAAHGWDSIQCFLEPPPEPVRQFLQLPNVRLDVCEHATSPGWPAARELHQLLRRHRPRIVHLHYTGFLTAYPWIAKADSASRVFITDHSSRPEGHILRRSPAWKRLATRVINAPVSRVVSVSGYGYRCMTALDVMPPDRVRMIYNSVEFSRVREDPELGARFRARHGIPTDRPLVTQVSWIIPEKGVLDLLAAAHLLVSQGVPVHFALVGEGRYREQYMKRAEDMGLGRFVTWTGVAQDPFADGVYAAADVVCQVSRWEEVFGWTIAEAMAHRRPVIGTRVGGIPELIEDGVTGFLVNRGDAPALAGRILQLLESAPLRLQMGAAARRQAELKFDLATNVGQLLDVYGIPSKDA